MKFPLATAITTILVLFSASCSAAPAGTTDETDVILKEVQGVYSKLDTFRSDFGRLRATGDREKFAALQEKMDEIFLAFTKVNAKINTQLGIPDAPTRYGQEGEVEGINNDEYDQS